MPGSSQSKQTINNQSGEQLQLVSFSVGDELFAVDILRVQEINRMMDLTKVPQSPEGVEGVINLRGRIIPVLDLRTQFRFPQTPRTDQTRIVVVEVRSQTIGFVVDSVHEVMRIQSSIVDPNPSLGAAIDSSFVSGVAKLEGQLLILIELDNLLSVDSLGQVSNMGTAA